MTLPTYLKAAAGNSAIAGEVAEAIDFDGTNDYLSRSSDLTGNTDSSAMTFSAWIWLSSSTSYQYFYAARNRFTVGTVSNTTFEVNAYDSSGIAIKRFTVSSPDIAKDTFVHFCCSFNTLNIRAAVNDVVASLSVSVNNSGTVDFTQTQHFIGRDLSGATLYGGRLSNVFLDYTYRDLSVTANRRLFVTADLKPAADQASLNPILYLPLNDPTAPGANAGTGGDFTLTGTIARSGRGPNQYNAPYSDLDGSNDYLLRTASPTGIAASKQVTFSIWFQIDVLSTQRYICSAWGGSNVYFVISKGSSATDPITVEGKNSSGGTTVLRFSIPATKLLSVVGRNNHLLFSVDLADTGKRKVFANGQDITANITWSVYTNSAIAFANMTDWAVGCLDNTPAGGAAQSFWNGKLGALWFNTSYIDLSVAANLEKFVTGTGIDAKPVDLGASGELPTGTSPLIYLPMYGNNAGKNYGTGGDFTVNSGPYTGARGPNEFWGNKADFYTTGPAGFLSKTTSIGISDGKIISFSFWYTGEAGNEGNVFEIAQGSTAPKLRLRCRGDGNGFYIYGWDSAGTQILLGNRTGTAWVVGQTHHICGCIDLSNTSNRFVYDNDALVSMNWTTYTNSTLDLSPTSYRYFIAGTYGVPNEASLYGILSEFYFTTEYIDFSQEANRLKFRDAFGNPVDLTQQIEDAAIPNPAIYMRFDPASFGTNYGTGGNFTVNGTITDGGQL